jgi:glutamate carboxypeptidase
LYLIKEKYFKPFPSSNQKSMKKSILSLTILLILSAKTFSQNLTPTEAKIIAKINAQLPQTEALLKKIVNINSGTLNIEGVREVGAIFRKEFDDLGFKTE